MPITCPNYGHEWTRENLFGRTPDPDVLIRCDCGAEWTGRHAVNNSVIALHREREQLGIGTCRVRVIRDHRT
jgi:hypothetical protein